MKNREVCLNCGEVKKKVNKYFCSLSCSSTYNNKKRDKDVYNFLKGKSNPSKDDKIKKKISRKLKGRKNHWMMGKKNHNFGGLSEEVKKKLSKLKTIDGRTTYRKRYIERFGNPICKMCGTDKNVDLHHVISCKRRVNGNSGTAVDGGIHKIENLIPLCRSCHRRLHNVKR